MLRLEPDTLALLAEHDPDALCLRLLPCVQLIQSPGRSPRCTRPTSRGDQVASSGPRGARRVRAEAVVVARHGWRAG